MNVAAVAQLFQFRNLDFEAATLVPISGENPWLVQTGPAFPYWSVWWETNRAPFVVYNSTALDSAGVSILDTNGPHGVLQGRFTALLYGGFASSGPLGLMSASIAQTGKIPQTARTLLFDARFSTNFAVSIGGEDLLLVALTSLSNYVVYGADINRFAGQTRELRFTSYPLLPGPGPAINHVYLDEIRFSNSPLPGLAPNIRTPPQTQTAYVGSVVDFQASAEGAPPLAYQWFFNRTNLLSGATNSHLPMVNLQFSQSGDYAVVVTNSYGAVTSAPAVLNIIVPVEQRMVPRLTLSGQLATPLHLEYSAALAPTQSWTSLYTMSLTNNPAFFFDLTSALPSQRFYRAWQAGLAVPVPSLSADIAPALTLTGSVGNSIRVDGINQFGPTDAWFTLATVTLTNTSQLYFDVTAPGQPARLWRIVPLP